MKKYRELKKIIIESLSDGNWHTTDELQKKSEECGISFESGRGPIYNIMHQLKKDGEVEADGAGQYKLNIWPQIVEEQKNNQGGYYRVKDESMEYIKKIETLILKYRKFDWINCSEKELQEARYTVNRLVKLSEKIQDEFGLQVEK